MAKLTIEQLADALEQFSIQDIIKAYAVHHPDAVATPEQVQRACDLHADDDISVDAEAFTSPVDGEGVHVMGWLWCPADED